MGEYNVGLLFRYSNWSELLGVEKPDLKQRYILGEADDGGDGGLTSSDLVTAE